MDDLPLLALLAVLVVLLLVSGFFSMTETALMAANRYRLRHRAEAGDKGAKRVLGLLAQTDRMLGAILLGNNLVNAAAATLVSVITITLVGDDKWALGLGTLAVTFCILVVSEVSPKIVGAAYADRLAPPLAFLLTPLMQLTRPVVGVVNLFANGLLSLLRLRPKHYEASPLSREELRSLVLGARHLLPGKHQSILVNLFDLERITVDDVMTPRTAIEAVDLEADWEAIAAQVATSYHTRLPVYRGDLHRIVGILHLKRVVGLQQRELLSRETLEECLAPPYFIPAGTPAFAQLQFFQENRQRLGLVVDEYGEIDGLLTLDDIIEEIVGEFTTSTPAGGNRLAWGEDGSVLVDGSRSLRELNRKLGLDLPLSGPKTLNGLIVEYLQDIPESGVGLKVGGIPIEVVHTQDRSIKTVRLFRPTPREKH